MKWLKWPAGILVLLAVSAGAFRIFAPVQMVLTIAMINKAMHRAAENHPVAWDQGPATRASPADQRKPNIVVILADDLGFNDITAQGGGVANGAVPTPNIDSIAKDGAGLANGYAGNATCAPSRAAIMTGRYGTRFGFEFTPAPVGFARILAKMATAAEPKHPAVFNNDVLENIPPLDTQALPPTEITIAAMLKQQGYHTIHFGKWHLGGIKGSRPEDVGFDESLGFIAGASMYLPEDDPDVVNMKQDWDPIDLFHWYGLPVGVQFNGSPWFKPASYMTDYLADEAVQAIHANRKRPFFIYFAPNAVHVPLQATREDYDALPQIADPRLRVYGAMVRALDRGVGKLLGALKDEGLERNTLVIFTSDNGGAGYIGLPEINKPYRGWKATFFEGGMHVPYFLRWTARIQPGTQFTSPAAHVDIFATAAAAAGAALPTDRVMDGVDLLPYITGQKTSAPHQNLFWRSGAYAVMLQDGWKLQRDVFPTPGKPVHLWLYNLNADPTEQHNLVESEPEKLKELLSVMDALDHQQAKPLWPSLLAGAIAVDHSSKDSMQDNDEIIYWYN